MLIDYNGRFFIQRTLDGFYPPKDFVYFLFELWFLLIGRFLTVFRINLFQWKFYIQPDLSFDDDVFSEEEELLSYQTFFDDLCTSDIDDWIWFDY
jgi:hypothetical protein